MAGKKRAPKRSPKRQTRTSRSEETTTLPSPAPPPPAPRQALWELLETLSTTHLIAEVGPLRYGPPHGNDGVFFRADGTVRILFSVRLRLGLAGILCSERPLVCSVRISMNHDGFEAASERVEQPVLGGEMQPDEERFVSFDERLRWGAPEFPPAGAAQLVHFRGTCSVEHLADPLGSKTTVPVSFAGKMYLPVVREGA